MTEHITTAATVFLMLFRVVAAFDGLYLHLWKYRLYARSESRREHELHTAQRLLFVPVVFFLFYKDFIGMALWAGVLFIALEQIVEIMDVLDERDSRAGLGGLSPTEYAAHVVAITERAALIALALAVKPLSEWSPNVPPGTRAGAPSGDLRGFQHHRRQPARHSAVRLANAPSMPEGNYGSLPQAACCAAWGRLRSLLLILDSSAPDYASRGKARHKFGVTGRDARRAGRSCPRR
ncbi:MAG: hypothetical protein H7Z38_17000 [Rubrivivax sp.]|nr:hypothetical protein [Pyrinomonadaceae bacterium]